REPEPGGLLALEVEEAQEHPLPTIFRSVERVGLADPADPQVRPAVVEEEPERVVRTPAGDDGDRGRPAPGHDLVTDFGPLRLPRLQEQGAGVESGREIDLDARREDEVPLRGGGE